MPPAPKDTEFQYTVDIKSRLNDPGDFGDIVVKDQTVQGGRLVHVRDIGRIELGAQTYSQDFKVSGKPAAGIAIYQTPESNSLEVGKGVAATMAQMSRRFPPGLHYSIPYDTTTFINDSINEVYKTLYEAGILVLIVILVFLQNFRATLVPATTVPVTIIGAFAGMAALGFSVNLSTLFGIVLAIGIVVDDAIVIVEGVTKYIERGMSGHDSAIKAMSELFGPIIGITLVLMAVFIPASFVPGLTGNIFAQFALVIAATALISAVNAATLKPTQCALWLRTPVPPEQRNAFFRRFNRIYDAMVRASISRRMESARSTSHTAHGDFWNTWDQQKLDDLVARCLGVFASIYRCLCLSEIGAISVDQGRKLAKMYSEILFKPLDVKARARTSASDLALRSGINLRSASAPALVRSRR